MDLLSCYGSNIVIGHSDDDGRQSLECGSDRSCAEINAQISCAIWVNAYLAAENAVINAIGTNVNDFNVIIGGYAPRAFDGAEIIRHKNTTCMFYCYNYASNNIKSIKYNNCTNITFDCAPYAEKNEYCPDGM